MTKQQRQLSKIKHTKAQTSKIWDRLYALAKETGDNTLRQARH